MTPVVLKNCLDNVLFWSQNDLAKRLGVSANTVSAWMTGKRKIPKYAVAYVALATDVWVVIHTHVKPKD